MLFKKPLNSGGGGGGVGVSGGGVGGTQLPVNPALNHLGTPANDGAHSPSPKRVTIVEAHGAGSGLGARGGGGGSVGGKGGSAIPRGSGSTSSPPSTPPIYANSNNNNRNGQPPNLPPSCLKDTSCISPQKDNNNAIGSPMNAKVNVNCFINDNDDDVGNPIIASVPRPAAPRGSSSESGSVGSGVGSGVGGGVSGAGGGSGGGSGVGVRPPSPSGHAGPRSRSVERDLNEFVRACSVVRHSRARSVVGARDDSVVGSGSSGEGGGVTSARDGDEALSRLDAIIDDVINTSSSSTTTSSRGRRGRSPSTGAMSRSYYDPKNFDLTRNMPQQQQQKPQQQRARSTIRDAELDRLQRDVTSMTRNAPKMRGMSTAREFSVAREFSMGRDFVAPVESTISKVYVSSLEPTDKICLKVRAAIQREVTMTNKQVDLVWNKIQTLKETNDIMEEIICQTEDELCYCEELTDAVGLDLTDILSDSQDREQLLAYELQLLREIRKTQEEAGDAFIDGPTGDVGEGVLDGEEDGVDDPLQRRTSLKAMKKKAQKKFTRLKRRESEDIMNSTRCKIS